MELTLVEGLLSDMEDDERNEDDLNRPEEEAGGWWLLDVTAELPLDELAAVPAADEAPAIDELCCVSEWSD